MLHNDLLEAPNSGLTHILLGKCFICLCTSRRYLSKWVVCICRGGGPSITPKQRSNNNKMSSSRDLWNSRVGRTNAYRSDSPTPPSPNHINQKTLNRPLKSFLNLRNICSALKSSTFINGHRIGMFRDTERPYRRGFLRW